MSDEPPADCIESYGEIYKFIKPYILNFNLNVPVGISVVINFKGEEKMLNSGVNNLLYENI